MPNLTRRVLFMLLILAAATPWLVGPAPVLAEKENKEPDKADKNGEDAKTDADGKEDSDVDKDDDKDKKESAKSKDTSPRKPSRAGRISVPTGGKIAIIEVSGPILYRNHFDSIKRRVDRAINDGADLIVFDLDTPGGELMVALELSTYIRTLPKPTVAWVNDMALSAGILIASACDELVMSKASQTGDCAPIVPGQSLAPTERAKVLSPLLAAFRSNARENYGGAAANDFALFHAMCVIDIDVYQVRHKKTGELRLVSQADYDVMVKGKAPIDAGKKKAPAQNAGKSGNASGTGGGTATTSTDDEFDGKDTTTPLLTVTDPKQVGAWEEVRLVHNGSSRLLVTLDEVEAKDIGLSRETISSEEELKKLYGAASATRYDETWSESLVGFLVNPYIRACLLLLGIVGLLIEYFSPGLFVPGIIGVASLAVLIGAPYFVGLAQTWHLIIIVIGAALIIYEMFTMTTFGVLAVLGLLMFMTGLVLSGVQSVNGLPAPGSSRQIFISAMSFIGSIVLLVPLLFLLTKYFGSLPLLNRLILADAQASEAGSADRPHQRVSGDESVGGGLIQPGMTGTVSSTGLRPSGRVEFEDQLVDVASTGSFIEPGTRVRVLEVHGNMIIVEPDDGEGDSEANEQSDEQQA